MISVYVFLYTSLVSHTFLAKTPDTANRPAPLNIFTQWRTTFCVGSIHASDGKITVLA